MTPIQAVLASAGSVLLVITILGLMARRTYGACYSFSAYLVAVLVPQILMLGFPRRFYVWHVWLIVETLHALLKFLIAVEVAWRTLRAFPGALVSGRRALLLVLSLIYLCVVAVPTGGADYMLLAGRVLPRILNGTAWLFAAIAAVIVWYRLPVDPLHKAILLAFVPYLLVFTVAESILDTFGWHLLNYTNYLQGIAYLLVEAYWAWAVWGHPAPSAKRTGSAEAH